MYDYNHYNDPAEGEALIDQFERVDREENNYTENFYDIVDSNHRTVARY